MDSSFGMYNVIFVPFEFVFKIVSMHIILIIYINALTKNFTTNKFLILTVCPLTKKT